MSLARLGCVLLIALHIAPARAQRQTTTLYEGARLITGDGSAPIDDAAFLVENARFTRVGHRGAVLLPPGARRVDLTGKTVIPGLVDAHSHIGYMKDLTSGAMNYTRENLLDHLKRFAYFGVVASQAMGSDFGELPFELRAETMSGLHHDAARFLTAGRGLAPLDEISADNMRQAANPVTTPDGARALVQELATRKVTIVKTWVDGRDGTVKKLEPAIYKAIIDEAHTHGLRVAVHATDPSDAKELLRSGIDIFAHMISDVDDELVALFKEHPNVAVLSALCGPHRAVYAPWLDPVDPLIRETVRPEQIERLRARFPLRNAAARVRAEAAWDRLAAGIKRLSDAGVLIGAGTDGGGQQGDQFIGWTMHAELENLVMAGIPPGQGTRRCHEDGGRDPGPGRSWNGCARQERRFRRARRQPARRHHEHASNLRGLHAGTSGRSCGAQERLDPLNIHGAWPAGGNLTMDPRAW